MRKIDRNFWASQSVLVTGHMGFKGAWLCALLAELGAHTTGYGLDERPCLLYRDLSLARHDHNIGDVNDLSALSPVLNRARPDVLFHLAAQPIVLNSYTDPVGTFEANVMGTVRVLEAARSVPGLKAIVVITTDKVYRNNEWAWAYREQDELGGRDPYSASKAAAEIATHAMRASFFSARDAARIATARAGNVIGGGDWADHRLLPDAARSLAAGMPLVCRNPASVRPWQHVLDPLAGYLLLAENLVRGESGIPAWNFGPAQNQAMAVADVADIFVSTWGAGASWASAHNREDVKKESAMLMLDSSVARRELGWQPLWTSPEAVRRTAQWYRQYDEGALAAKLVQRDINDYLST